MKRRMVAILMGGTCLAAPTCVLPEVIEVPVPVPCENECTVDDCIVWRDVLQDIWGSIDDHIEDGLDE